MPSTAPISITAYQQLVDDNARLREENERLKAEMGKAQDLLGAAYGLLRRLRDGKETPTI